MKTWQRGRKKAPEAQRAAAQEWQKERVRIANLVSRKKEIEKKCCVCGKAGKILHNREDPYYITFICDSCKRDPNNLIIAEESRFDIRTKLNKNNLSINNFTDTEVIRIVTGYMNDIISLGDYCDKIGISRYQLNQVINRYKQLIPNHNIEKMIDAHSNKIQSEKLKRIVENKLF